MDQNSTNGSGTDKRNWRERLGIGAKEMPKLSDEFRSPPPVQAPAAGTAKLAPRSPQAVTRPAPMAPRAPAPKPQTPLPEVRQPRGLEPGAQDALADKLRAQRAAAEKLAEQRVQAARERAEAKAVVEPTLSLPPRTSSATSAARPGTTPPITRPKFSFAEDDAVPPRKEPRTDAPPMPPRPALAGSQPPLTPPRPALGGDRGQPPFLRPAAPIGSRTQAPSLRADGQPTYRPIDPATGYAPPPRLQPPAGGRGFGSEPPAYGARLPVRRPPAVDPYARAGEGRSYPADEFEDDPRVNPRLSKAPASRRRARAAEDDYEEVFEDEPAPRQRASARDYQNAYRETEAGFEEDQRRSSGPWLLLLALLVAALVTGGVVWFYNTKMKTVSTTQGTTDSVPVVAAPEQPAKSAPEQPIETQGQAPALKKKQIYDRIVGDQEVSGDQVVPTEEVPVQPANADTPTDMQILPEQGATPIPAPDAPAGATGQTPPAAATDEPAPLPLPPPPGNDTQGSLDQTGIEKIAAAASVAPEQGSTAPPESATASTSTTPASALPPPEPTTDGAVIASEPALAEPEPEAIAPAPVKKKAATTKQATAATKKKPAAAKKDVNSAEPIVLVPPSQDAPPSQGEQTAGAAPAASQDAQPPVKKKKTLLDLFNGTSSDDAAAAPAQQAEPAPAQETQVASLPAATKKQAPAPEPAPAPQKAATGSGYMVQLASFRSESEAQSEFSRLRSRYPDVVGSLPSRISQTSAGGSTRYRLGIGPLSSRDQATRVCNSLFSAGERDCLVRSQ